jgi:hypothetical protein
MRMTQHERTKKHQDYINSILPVAENIVPFN